MCVCVWGCVGGGLFVFFCVLWGLFFWVGGVCVFVCLYVCVGGGEDECVRGMRARGGDGVCVCVCVCGGGVRAMNDGYREG